MLSVITQYQFTSFTYQIIGIALLWDADRVLLITFFGATHCSRPPGIRPAEHAWYNKGENKVFNFHTHTYTYSSMMKSARWKLLWFCVAHTHVRSRGMRMMISSAYIFSIEFPCPESNSITRQFNRTIKPETSFAEGSSFFTLRNLPVFGLGNIMQISTVPPYTKTEGLRATR